MQRDPRFNAYTPPYGPPPTLAILRTPKVRIRTISMGNVSTRNVRTRIISLRMVLGSPSWLLRTRTVSTQTNLGVSQPTDGQYRDYPAGLGSC